MNRRRLLTWHAIAALTFGLLYWQVLRKLVYDWSHDENYSHGFLIVPIAFYFAWERRQALKDAVSKPSMLGLAVIIGSLMVLVAGKLGAELFLTRISMIGIAVGVALFVFGWEHLRILFFPISFLLLMIPIPSLVFNQIAFPLQLLASRFGEWTLQLLDIPVLREGNVIILANTRLEVAEACSGIRSLISLLTLGIVLGYFTDPRPSMRWLIALATVPVAIAANGVRVAGTGVAAHYVGAEAATGFLHTFSGWLMFVLASALLIGIQRGTAWVFPPPVETVG
jgi:exosortase